MISEPRNPSFRGNEGLNKVAHAPFLRLIYISLVVSNSVIGLSTYPTLSRSKHPPPRTSVAPGESLRGVVLFVVVRGDGDPGDLGEIEPASYLCNSGPKCNKALESRKPFYQ